MESSIQGVSEPNSKTYLAGKKQVRTTRNVKTISLRKEDFPKKGKSRQVGSAKEPSNSVLK
ncbi:hypothetical protein MUK42_15921 [Musa troglodytarum]|uniref:Uncharacterized protein n=1 Tax=Musa troglodytarum TaxID=320322 RepID=A0A9E7HVX1_9LILI|nr:hypothetical protein MUK42_15921 [Musa troglodytarum]